MQSIFILGRQPALGLAELEAMFGAKAVATAGAQSAVVEIDPGEVEFDNLGGSTKFGSLITTVDTTDWRAIEKYLVRELPEHIEKLPEGKLTLGLSVYGLQVSPAATQATGLTLKKVLRKTGRSVRLVPNKEQELSTAQVLHNGLTRGNGWELLIVRDGNRTLIAQTVKAQDIDSYTIRDRERPKRDTRVGMLPPKLAQLIINLAVGPLPRKGASPLEYLENEPDEPITPPTEFPLPTILDPFCGTGVALQESLLMGYGAYGSDIDPRMVEYSVANLRWLSETFETGEITVPVEVGDATTHTWTHEFTHVACETYLGRPFTAPPSPEILNQTVSECNLIIKKFLRNIRGQVKSGTRLCLAVPAWQVRPGRFKHLPLLNRDIDSLEEIGYNRISFEHVASEELLYYRSDQIVARELLVLVKK